MDDLHLHSAGSSPYINEIDLQPPSPRDPTLDLYSDYNPEYSAEYTGSPYSSHSDISFTGELAPIYDSYDPTDFDNPHSGTGLLMFDDPASSDYYPNYYRSPSPSGSDINDDNRSRASSASSSNTNFSPNMGVTHSFEHMSFNSPNWNTEPLPGQKAPSPPRLLMPDQQPPIIINAPDDQDNNSGPGLHVQIVPATPVSGGGDAGNAVSNNTAAWLEVREPNSVISSRSPSPTHSLNSNTAGPSRSASASPQPPFLFPQPRSRSKSDTALEPPNWGTVTGSDGFPQQHPSQQVYHGPSTTSHPQTLGNGFTFGTPSPQNTTSDTNSVYLSPEYPEFQFGAGGGGTQLRRSKSDANNNPVNRHNGRSRSDDFRLPNNDTFEGSGGFLVPPSPHVDLIRQQQQIQQQQQFLTPSMRMPASIPIPPHPTHSHSLSLSSAPSLTPQHAHGVHNRHVRSSSTGSRVRSERGSSAGAWEDGLNVPGSNRVTPYPSPHASPRGRYLHLEQDNNGFDFAPLGIDGNSGGVSLDQQQDPNALISVSKVNVTTGRTANASQRRRKQEATFICPVPGCGSTFTRSFNLKGHIRSHNEEKPFHCHWPGCGKGFARQHDCKRHEQLHTNYRPFNCEGCGKQFARMDALNRHLRSEGGAECAKVQEATGGVSSPPASARSNKSQSNSAPSSSSSLSSSPSLAASSVSTSATSQGSVSTMTMRGYAQQQQQQFGSKMEEAWGVGLSVAL